MGALCCLLDLYHPVCSLTIAFAADYRDDGPSIQGVGLPNLCRAYGCDFGYSGVFPHITGATGLIGGHLLQELQQRGEQIRALILPVENADKLLKQGVEVLRGDIAAAIFRLVVYTSLMQVCPVTKFFVLILPARPAPSNQYLPRQ